MNVKPKDLAMVVNAPAHWNGATCTVIEPIDLPRNRVTCDGPFWRVLFARPMPCGVNGNYRSSDVAFPDSMLRKIGGPDVETRSFDEMVREVTV